MNDFNPNAFYARPDAEYRNSPPHNHSEYDHYGQEYGGPQGAEPNMMNTSFPRDPVDDDHERRRDRERRERFREGRDRFDRYGDRDRDRRDRGYDRGRRDDRGYSVMWKRDPPTSTCMLKGLPAYITEEDIRSVMGDFVTTVADIRVVRNKMTGVSRRFAFVEFQTVHDALQWMEHQQGEMHLLGHQISIIFSQPRGMERRDVSRDDRGFDRGLSGSAPEGDWICFKCGYSNFKRRDFCNKCNMSKEESEMKRRGSAVDADGSDQVGTNPCNTLLLRGLDALTTEDNIIKHVGFRSLIPIKSTHVVRDPATSVSKGFAFLECNSVADASQLYVALTSGDSFECDGKIILVNWSKNTYATVMASITSYSNQPSQPSQDSNDYSHFQSQQGDYGQANGQFYDSSTGQYYNYFGQQDQQPSQSGHTPTQADTTNAAAAVADLALRQKQAKLMKGVSQNTPAPVETNTAVVAPTDQSQIGDYQYPEPDTSTFQYDESSGYYYDPQTTLYYDANSQYFYNNQTGQYFYWDSERKTYVPAPTDAQSQDSASGTKDKDKEKKEKVKIAKKIQKDMEKWAKTMNKQKEALKQAPATGTVLLDAFGRPRESATADAGFAVLEKSAMENPEDQVLMPPPQSAANSIAATSAAKPGLVASYGSDSDEEHDEHQTPITDWDKLACLLCKRRFGSKEILQKHNTLSDLHKKNLAELNANSSSVASPASVSEAGLYRDRAKERRAKYGAPAPPQSRKARPPPNALAPPAAPPPMPPPMPATGPSNIGSKMMEKMGWNSGEGLGKTKQGRVDPVQTQMRVQSAGLGASGSNMQSAEPAATYKDAVKRSMFARFQELHD